MKIPWILLFCLVVFIQAGGPPNELNVSKESPTPLLFWPMTRVKHDTTYFKNHRYAFLERTGPPSPSIISGTAMDVANFRTDGLKYIILNSFDDMGYNSFIDAISFNFNIYINDIDITQSTVLAQFIDANGTITVELRLEGLVVKARWLDINRVEYIGELKVKSGKWLLLGFQFNMLWTGDKQVDLYYIDSKGSATTREVDMGKDLITLPVMDKIVIGGDYFGGSTFKGEIGCIQIYDTSIIGGTREDSVKLCDQNKMDPEFGDYTIEPIFIPTTESATTEQNRGVTTEQTTEGFTTEQNGDVTVEQNEGVTTEQELGVTIEQNDGVTTEQEWGVTIEQNDGVTTEHEWGVTIEQKQGVTIEQNGAGPTEQKMGVTMAQKEGVTTEQKTTQYDVTMVDTKVTTNIMASTNFLSSSTGVLTTGYEPVVENCFHLKVVQTGQVLASPITSVQVTNLERCAAICNGHPHCLVFSLPTTGSGECRISDTTATTPKEGHLVYSM